MIAKRSNMCYFYLTDLSKILCRKSLLQHAGNWLFLLFLKVGKTQPKMTNSADFLKICTQKLRFSRMLSLNFCECRAKRAPETFLD